MFPHSFRRLVTAALLTLACSNGAVAATANGLREMTTDRPDATESPFTVDVGHVQLEMSVGTYTFDRSAGGWSEQWEIAPLNLRFGITSVTELGIFLTPSTRVTEKASGAPKLTQSGFGDIGLRAKINFWGNDGGDSAAGVIFDLKVPTAAAGLGNDKVEGAIIFPISYTVGAGWDGGAMTGVEMRYVSAGKYRPVWLNTITFARDLGPNVGGFVELTSEAGDEAHVATFNCGLTRKLDDNTQLDCGVNFGISSSAPDLGVFAGLSKRF